LDKTKKITIYSIAIILISVALSVAVSAQDYDYNVEDAEWAFLGLAGIFCILPIILFIVGILIAIWVYKDAEKRGSSGALWLIIVLFTGIIGLIIWLVVRPPVGGKPQQQQGSGRMCPNCGRPIPMDAQVCPYCGKSFKQ
jgi:predicted nucleic acid-binding Zn ribbon protein